MPRFVAELEFRFECDSLEAVPAELRRLSQVAAEAGFELKRGKVEAAPDEEDDSGPTGYVPLLDDRG
jgi:hypothetical protein